jgi:cell fate regulator YaaT (PSP1 superfamily)
MNDDDDMLSEDESVPGDDEGADDQPASPVERTSPAAAPNREGSPPGPEGTAWLRVKVLFSKAIEFCEPPAAGAVQAGAAATAAVPAAGTPVVVVTRFGNELGRVLGPERDPGVSPGEVRTIARLATETDVARARENELRADQASALCREKIEARGLDMKLVGAHYLLDEQKILFLFTSENRVDFRDLVRDLVAVFKTRIELRQIGVRDEARVVGGMGICGRALCCNSVTDRLRPVSIKMAKEQNLTLNSMKISGPCGRLLCCLSYEFDVYREARHTLPSMGARITFEGEEFRVVDVNILAGRARLQSESGRVMDVGQEALERNGQTRAWELRPRTGASPQK